ncbi:hypothetical protein [Candidatus Acidianus copahuensis]|uniref:hypothetical protein n=1 Tax=Candidatus Acidianus copahuensis TaxID=1160895 RepID=UPI00135F1BAF|nr:hypothetical protein [Candidatus Acidianus copahuensis]
MIDPIIINTIQVTFSYNISALFTAIIQGIEYGLYLVLHGVNGVLNGILELF